MDVWPENSALLTAPRRKPRRPVAGAIPTDNLEDWWELDEPRELPAYVYALGGFVGGAVGCLGIGLLAAAIMWRRIFESVTGPS